MMASSSHRRLATIDHEIQRCTHDLHSLVEQAVLMDPELLALEAEICGGGGGGVQPSLFKPC